MLSMSFEALGPRERKNICGKTGGKSMSIEWLRDLAICIFGFVGTAVLIFVAVLSYLCYKMTKHALDSVGSAAKAIGELSSRVGPFAQLLALVRGVGQVIDAISKLFRKAGGRNG